MSVFYKELQKNRSNLHSELDVAKNVIKTTNLDDDMGGKITATTRHKIFKDAIGIFKLIRHNKKIEVAGRTIYLNKRIKLHLYQLKKLKQENLFENQRYFKGLLMFLYVYLSN